MVSFARPAPLGPWVFFPSRLPAITFDFCGDIRLKRLRWLGAPLRLPAHRVVHIQGGARALRQRDGPAGEHPDGRADHSRRSPNLWPEPKTSAAGSNSAATLSRSCTPAGNDNDDDNNNDNNNNNDDDDSNVNINVNDAEFIDGPWLRPPAGASRAEDHGRAGTRLRLRAQPQRAQSRAAGGGGLVASGPDVTAGASVDVSTCRLIHENWCNYVPDVGCTSSKHGLGRHDCAPP